MRIKHILLDLDDTIYHAAPALSHDVDIKMSRYVADIFSTTQATAQKLRRHFAPRYGSTLTWLAKGAGLPAKILDEFLHYVHPQDMLPYIEKEGGIIALIKKTDIPLSIFTNAPIEHVNRVLNALGIEPDIFKKIYDIRFCNYVGKPDEAAYKSIAEDIGTDIKNILLVDDRPENVKTMLRLGGMALLRSHKEYPDLISIKSLDELPDIITEAENANFATV